MRKLLLILFLLGFIKVYAQDEVIFFAELLHLSIC